MSSKDLKYLRWAIAGAELFSTCSRRQHMALVVSKNGRLIGSGYNGAPPGVAHCVDGNCPRAQSNVPPGSPYDSTQGLCIANHAEFNALMWSDPTERQGATIYVTGEPCWECGRAIAGSGVARLVYAVTDVYDGWPRVKSFLKEAGVSCEGFFL